MYRKKLPLHGDVLTILPDFQEVLLAYVSADEVVPNLSASVSPLPQPDQVSLDLLAQRLHRGYRCLHVLVIQTIVTPI